MNIDKVLSDAITLHHIKVDVSNEHIKSLIRYVGHVAYSEGWIDKLHEINIDLEKDIGLQMQQIRTALGLSNAKIAQAIGVSQALLSYYENNKRSQSVDVLRKFLNYCKAEYASKNKSAEANVPSLYEVASSV